MILSKTQGWHIQGVTINPKGQTKLSFEWKLGHITNNNLTEALTVYQGKKLNKSRTKTPKNIIGDSTTIIPALMQGQPPSSPRVVHILWHMGHFL